MTLTEFDIIRCRNSLLNRGVENPTPNEIGLEFIREIRNAKLTQTDWRGTVDYPKDNQAEWLAYRQSLRDITTQTPSLDENGNLTGITWPTPPTD